MTNTMTLTPPTMPSNTTVFQTMIDTFGTAGTIAIAVIGGAIALGIISVLGMFGWRMFKKWISSSK
jgi:type IV secretory pathway VirB2 component (pilin)